MLKTFFIFDCIWNVLDLIEQNCYVQKQPPEVFCCKVIKIETLTQVFFWEFCEISKNIFFTEHLRAAASVRFKKILCTLSRSRLVETRHYYLL